MAETIAPVKKHSGWIWVIFIFCVYSLISTIISYYFILSGKLPIPEAQKVYFQNLNAVDISLTIAISTANAVAALLLFLLRKSAFPFFVGALAASAGVTIYQILAKGLLTSLPSISRVGMIIGWGLWVGICIYVKKMEQRGILS